MSRAICTTDRAQLRAWIPSSYSARRHVAGTAATGALSLALLAVWFGPTVRGVDLLAVPATLCVGSFLEYVAHRWLMHVPRPRLRRAWEAHTGRHHHFYRSDAPTWERPQDIWLILFSPGDTLLLVILLALPVALLRWLLAPGAWALTVATMIVYFLVYEGLHLLFHLPDGHPLLALPGVAHLRRRHIRHHDLAGMHANYGVTSPIWDWVFGTERGGPRAVQVL